ncbi:hypothetical protein ABBQ32_000248 [Trebouxia sp. C0010 RCD-2024]
MVSNKVVESAESPASIDDYIRVKGLRLVKPYYFDFLCSVKKRWLGMTIIDVFSEEFASRPRSYYEQAFEDGRLRIEGGKTPAQADTPLKDNHRMRHFIHRHEPPVLDLPVEIVAETDELVAVHKPASIPVHVSGQYRKNTVMALLQVDRPDLGRLFPVHRLDKPVSGLLLIAKSAAAANDDQGKILKAYIARVLGHFPSEAVTVDKHLAWDSRRNHAFVVDSNGRLAEKQSLGAVPLPSQLQQLQAKEAQTSFRLLSVAADGKTSLVECLPKTGRTHQIRVHLSWLGYPIANDSQYGGTYKGPDQVRTDAATVRKETSLAAQELPNSNKRQKGSGWAVTSDNRAQSDDPCGQKQASCGVLDACQSEHSLLNKAQPESVSSAEFQVPQDLQDGMCLNCPNLIPPGYPTDIHPLWLHAQSYSCEQWSFECPKPAWASLNWASPAQ